MSRHMSSAPATRSTRSAPAQRARRAAVPAARPARTEQRSAPAQRARRAKRAYTVEHLEDMDSFSRELMRATKERTAAILWSVAAVSGLLLLGALSLTGISVFSSVSTPVIVALAVVTVLSALASIPYIRQIRKIDTRDLEGAGDFFTSIKGESILGDGLL